MAFTDMAKPRVKVMDLGLWVSRFGFGERKEAFSAALQSYFGARLMVCVYFIVRVSLRFVSVFVCVCAFSCLCAYVHLCLPVRMCVGMCVWLCIFSLLFQLEWSNRGKAEGILAYCNFLGLSSD